MMECYEEDFTMVGEWDCGKLERVKQALVVIWKEKAKKGAIELANAYNELIRVVDREIEKRVANGL